MFWLLVGCLTAPADYRAMLAYAEDADQDGHRSVEWGGDDCNDDDPESFPGADERCDGVDNDCDGLVDNEPLDPAAWYLDGDGDGYGNPERVVEACDAPPGHVGQAEDCDDGDGEIHPQGYEVCDGVDNDCDGLTDDDDDSLDLRTGELWYPDSDGDGYGGEAEGVQSCAGPEGYIDEPGDCDDGDPAVNPNAAEVCRDGVDNDCSGDAPECALRGEVSWGDADFVLAYSEFMTAGTVDSNGDGVRELVIGRPERTHGGAEEAGTVYLLEQPYSETLSTASWRAGGTATTQHLGSSIATGVDLNDDGFEDMAVGSPGDQSVQVYLGSSEGFGSGPDYLVELPDSLTHQIMLHVRVLPSGEFTTSSMSKVSDTETAVHLWDQAPTEDSSSDEADWELTFDIGNDWYLPGAQAWGDLNGDGSTDFFTPNYKEMQGHVFLGPLKGVQTERDDDIRLEDIVVGSTFGDFNSDGYQDLAIGDSTFSVSGEWNGAAHIFFGGPASPGFTITHADADIHIFGDEDTDRLGFVSAGDMDSDGNDDLLFANGDAESHLFYGPIVDGLTPEDAAATISASSTHVCSYSTLSDVDDDGSSDIIIGCLEGTTSLRILYGTPW